MNEIKELIRQAEREGWEVDRTRSSHLRFRKNGETVIGPSTTRMTRSIKNTRAPLRRIGGAK